ncbi:hypothetical protein H6775_02690 [Candidatus Nomurabacteria bacterium]|nr:hypothetical protein [Candidatus Nomurabacteria bacterium]
MLYFFTEKEKNKLKREYNIRFLTLLFVFLIITIIVLDIAFIPTLFLIKGQNDAAQKELDSLTVFGLSQDRNQLRDDVGLIRFQLNSLKAESIVVSELVREVTSRQIRSVRINVIDFKKDNKGDIVELQGVANNRESLVEFGNLLEESAYFEAVDLPVSSFTRSSDIPFLIKIKLAKEDEQ